MAKKHRIAITMVQETDGQVDNQTLLEEFSDDSVVHVIKTQAFVEAHTKAINEATQKLTGMALDALTTGNSSPKRKK